MADNTPNQPTSSVPPKPAEASKIQPKKETVRISLPPKPAAPQVKLPGNAPSINLIVPQVTEVDTNVKIPHGTAENMTAGGGPKPMASAPPSAPPSNVHLAPPTPEAAKPATPPPTPAVAPAKGAKPAKPAPMPGAVGMTAKASKVDMALAVLAAIVAIAGLVRVILLPIGLS